MHMVVGFILASLLKQKTRLKSTLPSIRGKFETVHAIPGRVRFSTPLLEGISTRAQAKIGSEIKKISGIREVVINCRSGSLLVLYDARVLEPFIIHGIVIKILGLETEFDKAPDGWLTREMNLIGRSVNQQIYQSSMGLIDLRSSLTLGVLMLALYRIFIVGDRALPGGINLLWWSYVMLRQGK
jgi:hypothetical protein